MDTYLEFNNNDDILFYESLTFDLIMDRIAQESRLYEMLDRKLIMLDESTTVNQKSIKLKALYESKATDDLKAKWQKFLDFLKRVSAKFMERVTKLLSNNKKYLDKYKDIILNKKPKDIDITTPGHYEDGIKNINSVTLPIFNYSTHGKLLKEQGDASIVKSIMGGGFNYKQDVDLTTQLKDYFIGAARGEFKGKLEQLNMKQMFDFCYDSENIKKICEQDMSHLKSSTSAIQTAINKELTKTESFLLREEGTTGDTQTQEKTENNPNDNKSTGTVEIKSSYKDKEDAGNGEQQGKDAKNAGEDATKVNDIVQKWIGVCQKIITAKMTCQQQIASAYMKIIRAHVRSYVGTEEAKNYSENNDNNSNDQNNNTNQNNNNNNQSK